MSAKPASSRAQRGRNRRCRALLVAPADCSEASRLCEQMGTHAIHAKSAFSAIGELTFSPAQEPIEVIVLAESAVARVSDHPARALRRIDPSVRLLLVRESSNGSPLADLVVEEFDEVLREWPSAEALMGVLRGEMEVLEEKSEVGGQKSEVSAPSAETPREQPVAEYTLPSAEPSDQLGDVDLVEAVMRSSEGDGEALRQVALDLIRQHTGWSDVAHIELKSDERTKPQAGSAHEARIAYGDRILGILRSRKAPPHELARWADWLARWLALDEDHRTWRRLSQRDELTGAYNRRYFMTFLTDAIKHAAKKRLPVAVMVFDLDDFKRYNDEYGHAAGDEILRETVRLLNSVIRKSDRVCRIGGDEFAVIFTDPGGPRERGSAPPETAEILAQRFQDQVCKMHFPKLGIEAPGTISVSAGLATFPWDGWDPEALLNHADALALQSKRKGKNALTLGRGAQKSE